jgi:UDP-glucose 4-epimerase
MRVLVTGGSGFIGSHVVDKLVENGVTVRIFDMVYPEHWGDVDQVEFYKGSISNLSDVRMAINGVDAVVHMAAIANVNHVVEEPHYAESINVRGTMNVLEAMRKGNVDRLVFVSTSWVYSDVEPYEVDEGTPLAAPEHLYTATKIAGEFYCQSYAKHYDLEITIVRYGIPYGPRARGGTVLSIFTNLALQGEPLTVFGSGEQFRNFVYVEDLADGTVLSLMPAAKGEIYNLTGAEVITINQVAETVQEVVGDVEIIHQEAREEDFGGKLVDNSKAKEELGWSPTTTFGEGVRAFVEWYKQQEVEDEQKWIDVDERLRRSSNDHTEYEN